MCPGLSASESIGLERGRFYSRNSRSFDFLRCAPVAQDDSVCQYSLVLRLQAGANAGVEAGKGARGAGNLFAVFF